MSWDKPLFSSRKAARQIRFTLAIARLKSALIEFLNNYNEFLKKHKKNIHDTPSVPTSDVLEAIFRQQMSNDIRDKKIADKVLQEILNLPETLFLPDAGKEHARRKRLQDLAMEDLSDSKRLWLREIVDQLSDIPTRIRGEVRGRYVRTYALKLADEFEKRLMETREALHIS